MSEERLQEIKDSIEFQYTLAKAKGYDNALLFTNEEEELVEEIERLNNIINELSKENQKLKEKTKLFHKNGVFSLEYDKETLRDMVLEYQEKIDKAIEYIESYMPNYDFDKTNLIKILEILQGSDKE